MKKVGFFVGCNTAFNRPDNEAAVRYALPKLGVEIDNLDGQTCCPAFGTMPSIDDAAWAASSAWNLIIAEERGVDIVTTCGSCYGSLSESYHNLHAKPALKEKVNEQLAKIGKQYKGTSQVRLLVNYLHNEIGLDAIKQASVINLNGLKIAVQPGCHTIWPSKAYFEGESDAFHPARLRALVEALGGIAPSYSRLTDCCGMGAMRSASPERSMLLFKKKLETINTELAPDLIVTGCNSCLMQFDMSQDQLQKKGEIENVIPAMHIMQLLAICLGADPKQITAMSVQNMDEILNKICGVKI
ncbi:MAG TPA: CoB--CoM heterodisulfide reductase iron-sulfur subunit B family protein [Dissulfurispiraceae bacterium]|nr:CoB--CoM heterodisulfide reductase iron-sulfur subunit B family protein [Dissulfurispiraceae bacterium]